MKFLTIIIMVAFGAAVLAMDVSDYVSKLKGVYGSRALDSLAELFKTDTSLFAVVLSIDQHITEKPWYSATGTAEEISTETWYSSFIVWQNSVASAEGYHDWGELEASETSQVPNSGIDSSFSKYNTAFRTHAELSYGRGSSGSGSISSASTSESSSTSKTGSNSASSSDSGANKFYSPFGAALGPLIFGLI